MFGALAHTVDLAIEIHARQSRLRIRQDQHLERWHTGQCLQSQTIRIGGHHTPRQHLKPLLGGDLGNGLLLLAAGGDVTVQERDASRIVLRIRQRRIDDGTHELIGHAHQNAGTITGVLLRSDGPTMVEVDQHLDGIVHDLAFRPRVEGGDHTDTAGIMLGSGIIHPLRAMNRQI